MRSHAEMRELAHEVLDSYEPRDIHETALAVAVLDLLAELEHPRPAARTEERHQMDSVKELVVLVAILIVGMPVFLLGHYVSWWLAIGLWEAIAFAFFLVDSPKWQRGKWVRIIGVVVTAMYGPFALVYLYLLPRLPARFLSGQAS